MYFNNWKECCSFIIADTYRYTGQLSKRTALKLYIRHPEYRYIVWMRVASYAMDRKWCLLLYALACLRLQLIRNKTGIQISPHTKIGKGFYIGHFGSIVINTHVEIGDNVSIIQTCTMGIAYRGKGGAPVLGDKVYVGPGARIIGGVHIGNNVAIGTNAVVTHDAPNDCVMAGVPARPRLDRGADEYIFNTVEKDGTFHPRFSN